jgi:hypothetical protein
MNVVVIDGELIFELTLKQKTNYRIKTSISLIDVCGQATEQMRAADRFGRRKNEWKETEDDEWRNLESIKKILP